MEHDGRVFDSAARLVGRVSGQGRIFDPRGELFGEVDREGAVRDWRDQYAGYVAGEVGPVSMGAAALLLLGLTDRGR